jgi:hypothetical protein
MARDAAEALLRLDQFDCSSGILDWMPDAKEHVTVVRRLKQEGMRFLFLRDGRPRGCRERGELD